MFGIFPTQLADGIGLRTPYLVTTADRVRVCNGGASPLARRSAAPNAASNPRQIEITQRLPVKLQLPYNMFSHGGSLILDLIVHELHPSAKSPEGRRMA